MGGKLIYEFPKKISIKLTEEQRKTQLETFITFLEDHDECELADFVFDMKDGFFNNLTCCDYELDEDCIISKGTKIIKSFKHFISDKEELEYIQNYASRIIQQDKIEGIFCISVHPLDYLTLSENTHNWSSCHSLDGDYRAGNLNYMADSATIISYVKSENDICIPSINTEWNSKKWRTLLFSDEFNSIIFAGRSYPFNCNSLMEKLIEEILVDSNVFNKKYFSSWYNSSPITTISLKKLNGEEVKYDSTVSRDSEDTLIPIGYGLKRLSNIVIENKHKCYFNDLFDSNFYIPLFCYGYTGYDKENDSNITKCTTLYCPPEVRIGENVFCLNCGKNYIKEKNEMFCHECY